MKTLVRVCAMAIGGFLAPMPAAQCQIIAATTGIQLSNPTQSTNPILAIENVCPGHSLTAQVGLGPSVPVSATLHFTPMGYHHAYLAHQLAPMIGVTAYRQFKYGDIPANSSLLLNTGFKWSRNHWLGTVEYAFQPKATQNQNLTIRVGYVVAITADCLKKRIHNHHIDRMLTF
jgi:hypothetical protein